jgi:hypothetical protein
MICRPSGQFTAIIGYIRKHFMILRYHTQLAIGCGGDIGAECLRQKGIYHDDNF